MAKRCFLMGVMAWVVLSFLLIGMDQSIGLGAEKVRFVTAFRGPSLDPAVVTAQEKGLWNKHGVEVEWTRVRGTALAFRAVMAGNIDMGLNHIGGLIPAVSTGVTVIAVADTGYFDDWHMWVKADSPIRQLKDLKGGKVGISKFGGTSHAYTAAFLKGEGLEKDVKIVAIGGMRVRIASVKTGGLTGFLMPLAPVMDLKLKGELREMGFLKSHLPRPLIGLVIFSEKKFLAKKPQAAGAVIRAFLQAVDFELKNPSWTIAKLESVLKYSPQAASEVFKVMVATYTAERGKINPRGVINSRNFLIEYGLMAKEKAPPVDELYTNKFFQ